MILDGVGGVTIFAGTYALGAARIMVFPKNRLLDVAFRHEFFVVLEFDPLYSTV